MISQEDGGQFAVLIGIGWLPGHTCARLAPLVGGPRTSIMVTRAAALRPATPRQPSRKALLALGAGADPRQEWSRHREA
jgi:hypothetical protein